MYRRNLSLPIAMCLAIGLSVAATAGAQPAKTAAACTPATNIEAIIDDSGSMSGSDPDANRAEAIKLLIAKSGNAKKTLGTVEFGSGFGASDPAATTLFGPSLIGPNAATMAAALDANLKADHGATDYNSAFTLAKSDNPGANARIFITDGGHNEGDYLNGHAGGPPTYVLGMGIGPATPTDTDAQRLQQIAGDTGGIYYPNVDNGNVQATVNQVDAALSCQAIAKTFTDSFTKAGQVKKKSININASSRSIDFTLTWTSPLDTFTIGNLSLKTKKGATISIAKKRLKIKRSGGKTFLNVHVTGLKKGKLRFRLKNTKLTSFGAAGVNLTTQASQSRKR